MAVWPASLPQAPQFGWGEDLGEDNVIRGGNAGPKKMRRRFTAVAQPITWPTMLTTAQVETLQTFYEDTIRGVEPFDVTDPRTGATVSVRFRQRPEWVMVSVDAYRAVLQLERMPAPNWP